MAETAEQQATRESREKGSQLLLDYLTVNPERVVVLETDTKGVVVEGGKIKDWDAIPADEKVKIEAAVAETLDHSGDFKMYLVGEESKRNEGVALLREGITKYTEQTEGDEEGDEEAEDGVWYKGIEKDVFGAVRTIPKYKNIKNPANPSEIIKEEKTAAEFQEDVQRQIEARERLVVAGIDPDLIDAVTRDPRLKSQVIDAANVMQDKRKTLTDKDMDKEKAKVVLFEALGIEKGDNANMAEKDIENILDQIPADFQVAELNDLLKTYKNLDAKKLLYEKIQELKAAPKEVKLDLVEVTKQHDRILLNTDPGSQQKAAKLFVERYKNNRGDIDPELFDKMVELATGKDREKMTEVEVPEDEKGRNEMVIAMRMAIIEESNTTRSSVDVENSFKTFISTQARNYGFGRTHFPKEFQEEIKKEYVARIELAAGMAFWDENIDNKELLKSLDRMRTLSVSTYKWLSQDKTIGYIVTKEGERVPESKLREEMNIVAKELYIRMMSSGLNISQERGEDRIKYFKKLSEDLPTVSKDAIRLTWQLAEVECWAARNPINFVGHPLGKVVIAAESRDFKTRKAGAVIGGKRLWSEFLKDSKKVYPRPLQGQFSTLGIGTENVYEKEGKRLARVGFEAWTIKIVKENDPRYGGGIRNGTISYFSEKGGTPIELTSFLSHPAAKAEYTVKEIVKTTKSKRGKNLKRPLEVEVERVLSPDPTGGKIDDGIDKMKASVLKGKGGGEYTDSEIDDLVAKINPSAFIGGERSLLAGEYFTGMEWLVNQPGFIDDLCPSFLVKADMIKGAAALDAMEALGNVEVGKASVKELKDLREALVSLNFKFSSNDLVDKPGGIRDILINGRIQRWKNDGGTQEKTMKSRIAVGKMMEEWTRSYVWLLSWENPSRTLESQVTGVGDWIRLSRSVAQSFDINHQQGDFVGFGYGNYDANELAVDEQGNPRQRPTREMIEAAKSYEKWFDDIFYRVRRKIIMKEIAFTTSKQRMDKEEQELKEYVVPKAFWKNSWWNRW